MKLMVMGPAVFRTEEEAKKKVWIFLRSCEKFKIEPHLYGMGTPQYPGYPKIKMDFCVDYLKKNQGDYTHALFTDLWDAFFISPLIEILAKYKLMGKPPMLTAADTILFRGLEGDHASFDLTAKKPFYQVGGFIAEIPFIIDVFTRMNRNTGDDIDAWNDAHREGWFRPAIDSNCEIFQVGADDCEIRDGVLHNIVTGSTPCILHLAGGFTDQVTGKDDRLIPWATKLGII